MNAFARYKAQLKILLMIGVSLALAAGLAIVVGKPRANGATIGSSIAASSDNVLISPETGAILPVSGRAATTAPALSGLAAATVNPSDLRNVGGASGISVMRGPARAGATLGDGVSVAGNECVVLSEAPGAAYSLLGCDDPSVLAQKGAEFAFRDVPAGEVTAIVLLPDGAGDVTLNGGAIASGTQAVVFRGRDTENVVVAYKGPKGPGGYEILADMWRR